MKLSGSDLHLFRVFDAVVRNNGVSAAQAELGLSQPTISNHLTALEERLGMKLCERGRRGFLLTDKGARVHQVGIEILHSLDAQSARLTSLRGTLAGTVRVGVVDCLSTDPKCQIHRVFSAIRDAAREVEVLLKIMRPSDITAEVARNLIDIGIGGSAVKLGSLNYDLLYTERHSLYCGPGDPLFDKEEHEISLLDCYSRPWAHRGYWSSTRRRGGIEPSESDRIIFDIEAQLFLIMSGAYVGLLPTHFAFPYEQKGRVRLLPSTGDEYDAEIEVVTRAGRLSPSVALVRKLIFDAHS